MTAAAVVVVVVAIIVFSNDAGLQALLPESANYWCRYIITTSLIR